VIKQKQSKKTGQDDAECAAIAGALETATRKPNAPRRVTIFTDAQAAILRMTSDEPGRGQVYALEARKHIATLSQREPAVAIELRWCPAHKGIPGNAKANEWAKLAADNPDARGVEHFRQGQYRDRPGRRRLPSRSHAHLKRSITEAKLKWAEAKITGKKYRYNRYRGRARSQTQFRPQPPNGLLQGLPAKDGPLPHQVVPSLGKETAHHQVLVVPILDPDQGAPLQGVPPLEGAAEDPVGEGAERDREGRRSGLRSGTLSMRSAAKQS
jgi:ribonuclease HI